MTVTVSYHLETNDLASHSRFFPAALHVPHHQLRNFISTVYRDKIYFVDDFDICVLDLRINQRALVATVPFEARCLAAAHGWVCVGGETRGDCAFLELDNDVTGGSRFGRELIVKMLGKEIVNSMSIHEMKARAPDQQSETVVLISNNDKTVTLYSLSKRQILTVFDHPVAMNYAAMSPDASIIAAVGDSNEVFFYHRTNSSEDDLKIPEIANPMENSWQKLATPKIPFSEGVWDDYSFAIAFSSNGDLCAVSAQGGHISVIDMEKLTAREFPEEDSILCTFKSSRPSLWGCVRSLSFSPEPWDLLAWTEDHGRAGIADVRQGFSRRQCIILDRNASNDVEVKDVTPFEHISLDVKERLTQQHQQRSRATRGHLPVGARPFDDNLNSLSTQETDVDLDQGEQSILSSLGTTSGDVDSQAMRPYSVNYRPSPSIRLSAAGPNNQQHSEQLLNPETQMDTDSSSPRRRNSVVLSESTSGRQHSAAGGSRPYIYDSPTSLSEDNSIPPMSTNDLTPSRNPTLSQPMPYNVPPSDPWHVIEAALGSDRQNQPAREGGVIAQLDEAITAERQLANRLERLLANERRLAARMRTQMEDRNRFLEILQRHAIDEETAENRSSPTLEHILRGRLQIEIDTGRQRIHELESEIASQRQTIESWSNLRETLIERLPQPEGLGSQTIGETIAQLASNSAHAGMRELEITLRVFEGDRRTRRQRMQELETEVRRAESRMEIEFEDNQSERSEQRDRLPDARLLQSARAGSTGVSTPWLMRNQGNTEPVGLSSNMAVHLHTPLQPQTALDRARAAAFRLTETGSGSGSGSERATRLRPTEIAGRVSGADIQQARMVLSRHTMDGNGNWIASNGYRRLFGAGMRPAALPSLLGRGAEDRSIEDIMRDEGFGTAGIGWSPDGKFLYVGTESGIFEFKIHTKDRMCFPSIQFR